jgi:cytochrome P450
MSFPLSTIMDPPFRPGMLAPAFLLVGYIVYQLFRPSKLPKIPIVGAYPGEWFPLLRARWRNAIDMQTATVRAYAQYKHEACILPAAGANDYVVLPVGEAQWLIDQPDSVLSLKTQIRKDLQIDLTVMDPQLVHNPAHHHLITTTLTRETGNLIPTLLDEAQHSVEEIWGTDVNNFREIDVWPTMQQVIGRITNRVFVGLPLCRNRALLETGIACAQDIPLGSLVLRFVWGPIRPLVALFVTLPNRIHTNRFSRILRHEITHRLAQYDSRQVDLETKAAEKEPNDFLQWSINDAKASGDPYLWKPDTLAGRIMLLNFASIHTSSFAIIHVLLDLASSKAQYIDELRAEITEVLASHGGVWNKRALAAMPKLDSTMRESQRLNSFVTVATNRTVVAPDGVTTPSGVQLAPGTVVCAQSYPVFHDPELYPEPKEFKPFRFSEKGSSMSAEKQDYVKRARQSWATTSSEYPAFGHGRHACPGRFFASSELKLLLAHILMNYDLEALEKRPENPWFGVNRTPPMKATLRVKRRAANKMQE